MAMRQEKFNLRWTAEQERMIRDAAQVKQKSVSAFILDQAYEAAQQILREQNHYQFSLTEQQWKDFCSVLDAPAKPTPALRKLMNTPSVFEEDADETASTTR